MNPLEEYWVRGLQSGLYLQNTDGGLRTGGRWCVMGVLCDVYYPDNLWVPAPHNPNRWSINGTIFLPPSEVLGAISLNKEQITRLMLLNDINEVPFHELADLIEEYANE